MEGKLWKMLSETIEIKNNLRLLITTEMCRQEVVLTEDRDQIC